LRKINAQDFMQKLFHEDEFPEIQLTDFLNMFFDENVENRDIPSDSLLKAVPSDGLRKALSYLKDGAIPLINSDINNMLEFIDSDSDVGNNGDDPKVIDLIYIKDKSDGSNVFSIKYLPDSGEFAIKSNLNFGQLTKILNNNNIADDLAEFIISLEK